MTTEGLVALKAVAAVLETNKLPYMLGGSFASSFYGIPRATFDADLVVQMLPAGAGRLYSSLKDSFYADQDEIAEAAEKGVSFNLVHLETAFKIDIFPLKNTEYDMQAFSRRRKQPMTPAGDEVIWLQSPEDLIISKLLWHQLGGESSAKQPADIAGVLKTQADALDIMYLEPWLNHFGLMPLFKKIQALP
jgi:hypothetical protein